MKVVALSFVAVAVSLALPPSANAQPVAPELPRVFLDTTYPTQQGQTRTVLAGQSIQSAIDAANPGDTIVIQAGTPFTGTITLKAKTNPNNQWIVIRSQSTVFDAGGAVPPGTRVSPSNAGDMAQLRGPGANGQVIKSAAGASYYRLVGLDVGIASGNGDLVDFVELGDGTDTSTSTEPSFIYIDRCYIHGNDTGNYRRGVAANGSSIAVIDSYLSDFHDTSDAQAIQSQNGPGPFKITNNFLEATGENILFGGDDPNVPNLVMSDIEVQHNHMSKRTEWRGLAGFTVKNLFELKNAQRVLVNGNLLEYSWHDGQDFAISFTVRNQQGGCTWCVVQDVTFTNNIVQHVESGINILGFDNNHPSQQTQRLLIRNNLLDDVNQLTWGNTTITGKGFQFIAKPANINIDHNTAIVLDSDSQFFGNSPSTDAIVGYAFTKNLTRKKIVGTSTTEGTPTLSGYAPAYIFTNNGLGNVTGSLYPTGNQYPDETTWENQFTSYNGGNGGDYHLVSNNIYEQAGNGDVGADIDALNCEVYGTSCSGGNGVLLFDEFDGTGAPDSSKWTIGIWSGATQDPSITVTQSGGNLQIGPLVNATGQHWNGIYSAPKSFSGAHAQVQVVQAPVGPDAYATMSIGIDASNYYRAYVNNGTFVCLQEIGGVKTTLKSIAWDPVQQAFMRLRNEGSNLVCETAPSATGTWTVQFTGSWNTTAVPLSAVKLELKAGTAAANANAGSALYDHFCAATPDTNSCTQ